MRHAYSKIVAYDPANNQIACCLKVDADMMMDEKASDEAFYNVYLAVDRVSNIIIGITITGDMYQLSPAVYGTYVKEDARSLSFINRPRLLVAIADYMKRNNIPFDR